jgi:transcriptional regulator with XRE-family HTH domain
MADGAEHVVLGSRLREARVTLGLTQTDVETALGITRSSVSDIEAGKRKVSGVELRRLARLYRRDVSWFLGEEGDEATDPALIDATAHLSEHDRRLVVQFARFLASQTRNGGV